MAPLLFYLGYDSFIDERCAGVKAPKCTQSEKLFQKKEGEEIGEREGKEKEKKERLSREIGKTSGGECELSGAECSHLPSQEELRVRRLKHLNQ